MSVEKSSANEIKTKNRQMIYQYIRKNSPVSKQDIVVDLQLSLPTVTSNLEFLKSQGLIDTSQKIKNTGGRNATAYTYIPDARVAIGVDITARHITAVVVDLSGNIVKMERHRSTFDLSREAYLQEIGAAVEQVKEAAGASDGKILGVGISVQGLISDDGEEITYGMALDFAKTRREEIARYIKNKNRLEHDSYVACYRETWENRQIHNAFYISLSNSVGGSVLIDDAIYSGNTQKGGEIGHMTVVPQGGELCYCGRRGCFDTVCRSGKLDSYTDGDLEEFFRLLKEGDAKAKELWEVYLNYLVDAIHNIHMLFDCNVILGGYVGAMIGDYMDEIRRRLDEKNPFSDKAEDYLLECRYKVAASAAGAALFYIDEFFENI